MDDVSLPDEPQVPPPAFDRALFLEWRSPRRGQAHPDDLTNPVWAWLVEGRQSAFEANRQFDGPDAFDGGPGWCFHRFGQTTTPLPDGRVLHVGGEHEDHYDPDFHIYNDVVVRHPDGRIQVLGYPVDVFPPTDFHTATLLGDRVLVVGSLGYRDQRRAGETPVYELDTRTMRFRRVETHGVGPGWIHSHTATPSEDGKSIVVSGGQVWRPGLEENVDDWRLVLDGWRWERLTERQWMRWEVSREDGEPLHLWLYRMAAFRQMLPEGLRNARPEGIDDEVWATMDHALDLERSLGTKPDLDRYETLFRPSVAHEAVEGDPEEVMRKTVRVGGLVVRYDEDPGAVTLTVEGMLPEGIGERLAEELRANLGALENAPCRLRRIGG